MFANLKTVRTDFKCHFPHHPLLPPMSDQQTQTVCGQIQQFLVPLSRKFCDAPEKPHCRVKLHDHLYNCQSGCCVFRLVV